MVYNPVIIFLPLQGDGMAAKSPDVWQVEKYSILNTNSRQETKKKSNNYREKKPLRFDEN